MFIVFSPGDKSSQNESVETNRNQTTSDSMEKWKRIARNEEKETSRNEGVMEDDADNMLQFEGVIYGFPGSAPGSQFVLLAHVHVESIDEGGSNNRQWDYSRFVGTPSSSTDVETGKWQTIEAEKTLSGKIVHRKQKIRGSHTVDTSSVDISDGKIHVMREFPAYHYRKRRNVFLEHMARVKKIALNKNDTGHNESIRTNNHTNNNNNTVIKEYKSSIGRDETANYRVSSKNSTGSIQSPAQGNSEIGKGSLVGVGTSAKTMISPLLIKLNRRRRSPRVPPSTTLAAVAMTAFSPPTDSASNVGSLSTHPHLHRFTTWDDFVRNVNKQITPTTAAGTRRKKRKSSPSSTWENLL